MDLDILVQQRLDELQSRAQRDINRILLEHVTISSKKVFLFNDLITAYDSVKVLIKDLESSIDTPIRTLLDNNLLTEIISDLQKYQKGIFLSQTKYEKVVKLNDVCGSYYKDLIHLVSVASHPEWEFQSILPKKVRQVNRTNALNAFTIISQQALTAKNIDSVYKALLEVKEDYMYEAQPVYRSSSSSYTPPTHGPWYKA